MSITITFNGKKTQLDQAMTVNAFLAFFDLPALKIAVERNREIVPKSTFDTQMINDGDQIEIVQFVGGG